MKYYKQNNVNIIECSPDELSIVMKTQYKKNLKDSTYTNGNFFAKFKEKGQLFTLPVGHLVCDIDGINAPCKYECQQRGKFQGNKYCFDSGNFSYNNPLYKKAVSTFVIQNGVAKILDLTHVDFSYQYAVTGVPIMRNGKDVKFATYVRGQGWDASTLYATKHIFVGLKKNSSNIFIMGWKSSTGNMISSGEAYRKFSAMGFYDVIKLDGGGSYHMKYKGATVDTMTENRMDNAYLIIKGKPTVNNNTTTTNTKPTRTLYKNDKGNDIKWVQEKLKKTGYNLEVDGSFGPASYWAFQDFCIKQLEKL